MLADLTRRSQAFALRTKVRVVILLVSSITLYAVVGAVLTLQLKVFRTTFDRDLTALAAIMASNCSAALDFEDPKAAVETLAALQANPGIVGATIVAAEGGRSFAHFGRGRTRRSRRAAWRRSPLSRNTPRHADGAEQDGEEKGGRVVAHW